MPLKSDTVQQVKDRLSIVDVVSGYVKLDRAGLNMRARCPFHAEKTPSFIVSPDRGTYHCFGCGVGGDIFSFVEAIEGVDFKGALKILAERAGVPLVYGRGEARDEKDRLFEAMETATLFYQTRLSDEAKEYLSGRGVTQETMRAFRIGYAGEGWDTLAMHLKEKKFTDKEILDAGLVKKGDRGLLDKFRNRIMFPIADSAGRIVAFSGRTFGEHAHPDAPKYLNSPETPLFVKSRILYGFDRAKQTIRKHNFAVLVEGQMDLVLSHQAGWANTVAVSGTAFTVEHAAHLKRMSENLVIALDPDEAGFKAASRAARASLQLGLNVKVARLPDGLDPADLIVKEGVEKWRAVIRDAKDIITFLLDVLSEKAKDAAGLRRLVEGSVLPFLADVQSPIAREQYEREIAQRLGVSEAAVREARSKIAQPIRDARPEPAPGRTALPSRVKQAYGILLWQESASVPMLDVAALSNAFADAVGERMLEELTALEPGEKEQLRFRAEETYRTGGNLAESTRFLMRIVKRERLSQELRSMTEALQEAESRSDEEASARLSETVRTLITEIAGLSEEV